jgi:methylmalonyl-CoA/ethylmalonyl-CoA epimerase
VIDRIHHINFLVRDLEQAIDRYKALLGSDQVILEDLPRRGVRTARFRVGQTWLVLLQPTDDSGVPGRYLEQHGEGFFMISFAGEPLDEAVRRVEAAGLVMADRQDRIGLDGWRVRDLDAQAGFGINVQLTGLEEVPD